MQQLWLMARASSCAVLSQQTFLHNPLPAHTPARPILTCNLKPLLPCTHRSYIVLLGLSDLFIHVVPDLVSEQHSWVIQRWTYSIVTVPEVLCASIHDEFHYSHNWKTPYPTHDHVIWLRDVSRHDAIPTTIGILRYGPFLLCRLSHRMDTPF